MDTTQDAINTANAVAKVGAVGAGSSPILNWLVENSEVVSLVLGIGGLTIAVAGFIVSWVYNHKRFKIQKAQFERRNHG